MLVFDGKSVVANHSFLPACQFSEPIVQAELSKLSPQERELHQFDMIYLRWALPGVLAFLWGFMLGGSRDCILDL